MSKKFTESLSNDEIKSLLKDYVPVDNIFSVSLNTHIRYFMRDKNGKKQFRVGGNLLKANQKNKYIVLTNGKVNWSVQVNSHTQFFKLLSIDDIRDEYEERIIKYKKKIRKLEETLELIRSRIKK